MQLSQSFPSPLPGLLVEDVGRPHLRVKICDIWTFFLEVGVVDDGCPLYTFLSRYCHSHAYTSFRFNPSCSFGKAMLKLPLIELLSAISSFIVANIWIQKPYFLQKRIRSCLLSKKHRNISLHKLIRFRLKPIPPLPPPPVIPSPLNQHSHKSSFQPIHITITSPPVFYPPKLLYHGLSLPRRHPREGVG